MGDACALVRGPFGGSLKKAIFKPSGFAVYEQQHAIGNQFEDFRYFVDQTKFEEMERFSVTPGDIIMSCSGTMGKVAKVPDAAPAGIINQALLKISPQGGLDPDFLMLWMESPGFQDQLSATTMGVAIKNVASVKTLKAMSLPLPPLEEQQRVVAVLDEAFEGLTRARAHAEANLQNARELFPAILTALFTRTDANWSEKTLEELCEKITDGTHQTPKYFDDGYIFLSSKNVTSGKIDWENIKYIDETQHLAMQKRLSPQVGDVLLAKNGTTGVAAIVDRDVTFDIYVSLALLRSKGEILPEFLLYFTNSSLAKDQFNRRLKGSGVPKLHLQEIRQVRMPYPTSKEMQKELVQLFDRQLKECEAVIADCEAKLQDLDDLRQSLLQKAFAGELT